MTRTSEPADTRMMSIVHDALRRDLLRIREALTNEPPRAGRQRQALGAHVVWLMDILHAHHTSEDRGLWPAVLEKNPEAAALLDSLEADHGRIDPRARALRASGERFAASATDDARTDLASALDELADVLFPHLDREVEEAMPVVSQTLTHGEWRAIEQEHSIKPKRLSQLAFEGQWLLDGIDPEGYDVVVHTVPPIPRFILLHGFSRAYRRRARARWQPDRSAQAPAAR